MPRVKVACPRCGLKRNVQDARPRLCRACYLATRAKCVKGVNHLNLRTRTTPLRQWVRTEPPRVNPLIPLGTRTRYGRVDAVGLRDGERYYMLRNAEGVVTQVPGDALEQQLRPYSSRENQT